MEICKQTFALMLSVFGIGALMQHLAKSDIKMLISELLERLVDRTLAEFERDEAQVITNAPLSHCSVVEVRPIANAPSVRSRCSNQ